MTSLQSFYRLLLTIDFGRVVLSQNEDIIGDYDELSKQEDKEYTDTCLLAEDALTEILCLLKEQIQYHANRLTFVNNKLLSLMELYRRKHTENKPSLRAMLVVNTYIPQIFVPTNTLIDSKIKLSEEEFIRLDDYLFSKSILINRVLLKIEQFSGITSIMNEQKADEAQQKVEDKINRHRLLNLGCKLSSIQIRELFDCLIKKKYIDESTKWQLFENVFLGSESDIATEQIKWEKSLESFEYFFSYMLLLKMFNNKEWKAFFDKRKLFVSSKGKLIKAGDISAAKYRYEIIKRKNPVEATEIDFMLKNEVKSIPLPHNGVKTTL